MLSYKSLNTLIPLIIVFLSYKKYLIAYLIALQFRGSPYKYICFRHNVDDTFNNTHTIEITAVIITLLSQNNAIHLRLINNT